MLINLRLPARALVVLLAVSGCTHLPSINALNPFTAKVNLQNGVDPTKVLVVESKPARGLDHGEQLVPEIIPQADPEPVMEVGQGAAVSQTSPATSPTPIPAASPEALQKPEIALSYRYTSKAVTLGETQGVMDLPPTYWAVQVAAVKNIERFAEMVKEHQLQGMLGVPMNTEAGPLHAVLTGVFVNREDAQASAASLPLVFSSYQPWVRPLANLQAAMR